MKVVMTSCLLDNIKSNHLFEYIGHWKVRLLFIYSFQRWTSTRLALYTCGFRHFHYQHRTPAWSSTMLNSTSTWDFYAMGTLYIQHICRFLSVRLHVHTPHDVLPSTIIHQAGSVNKSHLPATKPREIHLCSTFASHQEDRKIVFTGRKCLA